MTTQDKVKELVQRAVDKNENAIIDLFEKGTTLSIRYWQATSSGILVGFKLLESNGRIEISLPDLILDSGFMKAVYGELVWEKREACLLEMPCKSSCEICLDGDGDKCIVCEGCDMTITDHDDDYYYNKNTGLNYCEVCFESVRETINNTPADLYRAQEAARIILTEGVDKGVDYLYENMDKEEGERNEPTFEAMKDMARSLKNQKHRENIFPVNQKHMDVILKNPKTYIKENGDVMGYIPAFGIIIKCVVCPPLGGNDAL